MGKQGLSRRHGDTEKSHCSNGSLLPFWERNANARQVYLEENIIVAN
jgi:hypothetical protein